MSYYRLEDAVLEAVEQKLLALCHADAFAILGQEWLDSELQPIISDARERYLLLTSITNAILSALSAPLLRNLEDPQFEVTQSLPTEWTGGAETGLVVGLGGLLEPLLDEPRIRHVHTIDLYYGDDNEHFLSEYTRLKVKYPDKKITFSRTIAGKGEWAQFDIVSITGSTLCNGTLEGLLGSIRRDAIAVLQGQSASIHPAVLFEEGISMVVTTLKPYILVQLAKGDRSGKPLRKLLDGKLSVRYFCPRVKSW